VFEHLAFLRDQVFQEGASEGLANMQALDASLAVFILHLSEKHPELTFLLSSSHGNSESSFFYETRAGNMESVLPLLFFALPTSIARRKPTVLQQLQGNEQQLVTSHDVYLTLLDFLSFPNDHLIKLHGGIESILAYFA
jgi:hypothetical protein